MLLCGVPHKFSCRFYDPIINLDNEIYCYCCKIARRCKCMEIFNVQIYYKEKIMPTRTVTFKTEEKLLKDNPIDWWLWLPKILSWKQNVFALSWLSNEYVFTILIVVFFWCLSATHSPASQPSSHSDLFSFPAPFYFLFGFIFKIMLWLRFTLARTNPLVYTLYLILWVAGKTGTRLPTRYPPASPEKRKFFLTTQMLLKKQLFC